MNERAPVVEAVPALLTLVARLERVGTMSAILSDGGGISRCFFWVDRIEAREALVEWLQGGKVIS